MREGIRDKKKQNVGFAITCLISSSTRSRDESKSGLLKLNQ